VFTASEGQPFGFVSYPDFLDFRKAAPMIAECLIPVAAGEPARMQLALAVTPDYFRMLGVGAKFGRTFAADDVMVAVLAHGSASDIGKTLRVGRSLYTVIGVAPENFGLDRFLHEDFYIPIRSYGDGKILEDRSRRFLTVHTRGGNAAEIASIAARLEREHPETNRGRRAVVLKELTARMRTDKMMTPLAGFLAALGALILLIGCVNACGALLMRGEARIRETALKMAMGANPMRLLGESLRESVGIAILGCALGLPCAWALTEALRRSVVLPTDFGISIAARIDGRVVALALAAALIATVVCGVAPSCLISRRLDVWATLKARERSAKGRARDVLVMVEIAMAAALAATGGSLWAGLSAAKNAELGYRTKNIFVITFDPGQSGYSEARTRGFYLDLMERVKQLPGVRGVALAQSVPLGMTGAQKQIRVGTEEEMTVWMNIVTPEYFERMGMDLVAGRGFDNREGAIVNEELAKRVGIGEKMSVGGRMVEVIGIVKTAKYMRWDEAPRPYFYLPYAQNYASRMTLHIESAGNVLAAARELARDVPASDARALGEYFDNGAMFGVNVALRVAEVVGGGGLLLALAGLYGVVSSAVARRRREMGIRVALGARQGRVFALIVWQGMTMAMAGTVVGLALAAFSARLVPGSGSFGWANAGAAGVMMGASFMACAVPAIRALRIDAAKALREE
jgi:predicted permease